MCLHIDDRADTKQKLGDYTGCDKRLQSNYHKDLRTAAFTYQTYDRARFDNNYDYAWTIPLPTMYITIAVGQNENRAITPARWKILHVLSNSNLSDTYAYKNRASVKRELDDYKLVR